MAQSEVGWTEPPDDDPQGVDHLGMRVAGETAYAPLVDFTTSVSWRPRYFSFLCWALGEAFRAAGGVEGAGEHKINLTRWREHLKRLDYLLAAVSLYAERDAFAIAGARKVGRAIESADGGVFSIGTNHLQASTGSLAIYAGPMRELGLIESAGEVSRPTRRGRTLAQAFEQCLAKAGLLAVARSVSEGAAPVAVLQAGGLAAISQLAPRAESDEAVRVERDALRDAIIDWSSFRSGRGSSSPRILSLGLLLAFRRMLTEEPSLGRFREATLLDGVHVYAAEDDPPEVRWLQLPERYAPVRKAWRSYQAHAFATLASEHLLSLALQFAASSELALGSEGAPIERLVAAMVASANVDGLDAANPFGPWVKLGARALNDTLTAACSRRRDAPLTEVELARMLDTHLSEARGGVADLAGWFHDAALLLFLSLARCSYLEQTDGPAGWLGDNDPSRLAPRILVARWREAVDADEPMPRVLDRWLREYVILQHRANALRKLAADPDRYTAKFTIEGGLLVPLAPMEPGTSSPRFDNAIWFLRDLGFLDEAAHPTTSADVLLDRISTELGA